MNIYEENVVSSITINAKFCCWIDIVSIEQFDHFAVVKSMDNQQLWVSSNFLLNSMDRQFDITTSSNMECGFSCVSFWPIYYKCEINCNVRKCWHENDEKCENCTSISKIIPFYRTMWLLSMKLHEHHDRRRRSRAIKQSRKRFGNCGFSSLLSLKD